MVVLVIERADNLLFENHLGAIVFAAEALSDYAKQALERTQISDKNLTVLQTACKGCATNRIYVTDLYGLTYKYVVYKTMIVDPYDTSCTSQLTDGRMDITLITCYNSGTQRYVVKAAAQ